MVQAAKWSQQQHFILEHPGQLVKNQFQHFPIRFLYERNTPLISLMPLHTAKKPHNSHANLESRCNVFSVFMCIPFSGTAVGHWRLARRAERLIGLSPKTREQVGEQGCQQGEMLTLLVSFHSLASLAPWKKQMDKIHFIFITRSCFSYSSKQQILEGLNIQLPGPQTWN